LGHAPYIAETAEKSPDTALPPGCVDAVRRRRFVHRSDANARARQLLLTGSLGEVMKESAQTAMSYLRSQSKMLDLDSSHYTNSTSTSTCRRGNAKGRPSAGCDCCGVGVIADQKARAFSNGHDR